MGSSRPIRFVLSEEDSKIASQIVEETRDEGGDTDRGRLYLWLGGAVLLMILIFLLTWRLWF